MEQPTVLSCRYCTRCPFCKLIELIDLINTGHHKNLDMIGKQNYQEPGVEAELNFEFLWFTIICSK